MGSEKNSGLATEFAIRSSIADIRDALANGPRFPNIWGYFSNKNQELLSLIGDVTFIQAVLLEGDREVANYVVEGVNEHHKYGRELVAQLQDGTLHWYICGRYENIVANPTNEIKRRIEVVKNQVQSIGAVLHLQTERDIAHRLKEFRNILTLSGAITRCGTFSTEAELSSLIAYLKDHPKTTIRSILEREEIDPALMLGAAANGIFRGYIGCDLSNAQLSLDLSLSLTKERYGTSRCENAKAIQSPITRTRIVAENRRTAKIPEKWRNLEKWPIPITNLLNDIKTYERNKLAVEMYLENRDFDSIFQCTQLREDWVRLLISKGITPHPDGLIWGFRALVKYTRMKVYERTKPAPDSNLHIAAKGGFAGLFTQLLTRFPDDLLAIIEAHVLKQRCRLLQRIPDARISWETLKTDIHEFLRSKGFTDDDYPFNTRDKAYSTIAEFGRSILFKRPIPFIQARGGQNAGMLANQGKGVASLIQASGPLQIVELDFHKHDAAAIVELESPIGGLIAAPVPRTWIGALVDTFDRAILGSTDSLEDQTTETCVMNLIDSAVAPPSSIDELKDYSTPDGRWLPNQIFSHFSFVGWDILRLDRAWAHKSTNVLSTLIATTGCAVCFSRPRAWWARSIVERTFRELTARGAQRLATTYGTGPNDTKRNNPEQTAISLKFRLSELGFLAKANIRAINERTKDGAFWESPMSICSRAEGMSTYFPRPLPYPYQIDRPTQWITLTVKVEAYVLKGIAPYVRTYQCRFRGDELASRWDLVGQFVYLQIHRNDIRKARVVMLDNGELIGNVAPEEKWMPYSIGWRNFQLIQKYGRLKKIAENNENPTSTYLRNKLNEVNDAKGQLPAKNKKRDARDIVKVSKDTDTATQNHDEAVGQEDKEITSINSSIKSISKLLVKMEKFGKFE